MRIDEGDFDGAVARLREHGYDPEIVSIEDDDRGRSLYVTDPDGNVVGVLDMGRERASGELGPATLAWASVRE
jgi:hypothetical protein